MGHNPTGEAKETRAATRCAPVEWQGYSGTPPPPYRYLGHTIAHPSWAQRDEGLAKVECDLTRYRALPLNAFERVQLLNSVLIPH